MQNLDNVKTGPANNLASISPELTTSQLARLEKPVTREELRRLAENLANLTKRLL
jgi:hypothetical protein